jgi:hypothetical protein
LALFSSFSSFRELATSHIDFLGSFHALWGDSPRRLEIGQTFSDFSASGVLMVCVVFVGSECSELIRDCVLFALFSVLICTRFSSRLDMGKKASTYDCRVLRSVFTHELTRIVDIFLRLTFFRPQIRCRCASCGVLLLSGRDIPTVADKTHSPAVHEALAELRRAISASPFDLNAFYVSFRYHAMVPKPAAAAASNGVGAMTRRCG